MIDIFFRKKYILSDRNIHKWSHGGDMSIFTLEKRTEVQEKLLEVGIRLIKEKGIRKMTISDVTSRAGIGKGTFYHFYTAKEFYAYDVIQYSKNSLKKAFNDVAEQNGGIDRNALTQILSSYSFHNAGNIVNAITKEDEEWLNDKLPEEYVLDVPKEEEIVAAILKQCKGVKNGLDYHVISNMMKIMALAVENKSILHEDTLDQNLELIRELLMDYIFGTTSTEGKNDE